MLLDVALVPAQARRWQEAVCILVDELRASSTIVTLLERGARAVIPASSVAEARRLAPPRNALLAGEWRVVRPRGFDFGNSPAEISAADVIDRTVILRSRNGTAVLRAMPAGAHVLVGCLLNAAAAARAALAMAGSEARVGIVCAGRDGRFAIDDAITAGLLVERIAEASPNGIELTDAAEATRQLWRTTPDLDAAFRASTSGRILARHDLLADLAACLDVDSCRVVPRLIRGIPPSIEPYTDG